MRQIVKSRQRGFTFTEILIVLAIIAGVTVLVLSQADVTGGASPVARAAVDVQNLIGAAQRYRASRDGEGYGGISARELHTRGMLTKQVQRGNPWHGHYLVQATEDGSRVVVVLTGVPSAEAMNGLAEALGIGEACGSGGVRCPTSGYVRADGASYTDPISFRSAPGEDGAAVWEQPQGTEGGVWGYAFR